VLDLAKVAAEAYARGQDLDQTIAILAASDRAMMIIDGEAGTIVEANSAARELFGDPLAGMDLNRLVPERYRQAHEGHRSDFMQRQIPRPMIAGVDVRAITRDAGETLVRIGLTPIPTTLLVIAEVDPLEG